jgi:putative membrane protein insertion efficiency factor
MRNTLTRLWHLPRNTIILLIRGYQRTLSPDHGPLNPLFLYGYCRHSPTCSAYAIEQLAKRGAVAGTLLALKRVLTCHPWRKPDQRKILETIERHFPKKP